MPEPPLNTGGRFPAVTVAVRDEIFLMICPAAIE
jgi:hypothetical protein